MELKSRPVEYYEVDYDDLDRFINFHFFGGETKYNFAVSEEANNDTSYPYHVVDKVDEYDRKRIDDRDFIYMTQAYLDEACRLGLVKPGKYLINVCW